MQTNHPLHAAGIPSSSARPLRVRFNVGQGSERCSVQIRRLHTCHQRYLTKTSFSRTFPPTSSLRCGRTSLISISLRRCLHHIGDPIERVVFPHSGVICMTLPLREMAGAVVALVGHEGVVGGLLATASMPSSSNDEVHIGGRASLIQRPLSVTLWIATRVSVA